MQPPEEIRDMMLESVEERSEQLKDYVSTVLEGLQSVANLLAIRKVEFSSVFLLCAVIIFFFSL